MSLMTRLDNPLVKTAIIFLLLFALLIVTLTTGL